MLNYGSKVCKGFEQLFLNIYLVLSREIKRHVKCLKIYLQYYLGKQLYVLKTYQICMQLCHTITKICFKKINNNNN